VALATERLKDPGISVVAEDHFLPRPRVELVGSGWIIQQLVKLQASKVVNSDYYLSIDSDTFFLRPRSFFAGNRPILYYSDQYEVNYNANLEFGLGIRARFPISFICHHMLFERGLVQRLLGAFELHTGLPWHEVVIAGDSRKTTSWFSEFDSYANFLHSTGELRRRYALRHWHGCDRIERKGYEVSEGELAALSHRYATAAFHLVDR
jgi:hypothetical protein